MNTSPLAIRIARQLALATTLALVGGGLTACAVTTTTTETTQSSAVVIDTSSFWDSSTVHTIDIAGVDYDALIASYLASGDKEWGTGTVTIDGVVFENVGVKLKGNSSLRDVTADADPATLPWVIRLDKFVDDQEYLGETEFVVRGNNSSSALNEALALELLADTGLATQEAVSSRVSFDGGAQQLRLVIQNPDEGWVDEQFGDDSALLYKAESGGDYSYRGDDAELYTDVFDQEAGDDNLVPLTTFLKFINESDDATFAAELDSYLDVESFATYLAFQDLIDNFDDIAGPGNNSYLYYDEETQLMTVVSWDLNLAFGVRNEVGQGATQAGGPQAGAPQGGNVAGGNVVGGNGGPSSGNILAERFMADPTFSALYDAAKVDLTASLFASGLAQSQLDAWVALLNSQAGDLITSDVVASDAASIESYFG
ncbi:MAG: CotH kinase family protein [Salinibacterium sp.]|nr:CotH kinase family protein [Salinibacterium sp.]